MLNQDQIRFYRENGYLVVAGVFAAEEFETLRRVTAGLVEAARGAPTLEPRQVALPVRIPLPRVPAADSIFDDQAAVAGRPFGSAPRSAATQEGAT